MLVAAVAQDQRGHLVLQMVKAATEHYGLILDFTTQAVAAEQQLLSQQEILLVLAVVVKAARILAAQEPQQVRPAQVAVVVAQVAQHLAAELVTVGLV